MWPTNRGQWVSADLSEMPGKQLLQRKKVHDFLEIGRLDI
jgi:hypothetical protein